MPIKIELTDDWPEGVIYCATKADWDRTSMSQKSYDDRKAERHARWASQGYRANEGPLERAHSEPYKFPCLAIEGPFHYDANGPDGPIYAFLYDFTVTSSSGSRLEDNESEKEGA